VRDRISEVGTDPCPLPLICLSFAEGPWLLCIVRCTACGEFVWPVGLIRPRERCERLFDARIRHGFVQ
jgi:hypothetical protein